MGADPLPSFRYHPDPVGTGSVDASDRRCAACGRARGYLYAGPLYAARRPDGAVCPWCIADGRAAEAFDATFTDVVGAPAGLPASVVEEITMRTPGFRGWQQPRWLFHCGDGCAFLGAAGRDDLEGHADAVAMLRQETVGEDWAEYFEALSKDGSPTAYLFRCLVCGTHLAYSDFD